METEKLKALITGNAPCYIYDSAAVDAKIQEMKSAFPDYKVLYSIKTNPYEGIIGIMSDNGLGSDASSAGEVRASIDSGIAPENIYYSSAGKTEKDIREALGNCRLIADSLNEIRLIEKVAAENDFHTGIGARINPDFLMKDDCSAAGISSKFGIDEEKIPEIIDALAECPHINLEGIHVHLRSQVMDAATVAEYYEKCYDLAGKIVESAGTDLKYINFGSGIAAVYDPETQKPFDTATLAETLSVIAERNKEELEAELLIESGRFLVCNAGTFYTPIVDIKESRGKRYYITESGMNGFMRPSLEALMRKVIGSADIPGFEPLFTQWNQTELSLIRLSDEETGPGSGSKDLHKVTVTGPLCTSQDILGEDVMLPEAEIGDIIAVSNAGSYGYTLSPQLFASHAVPQQIII